MHTTCHFSLVIEPKRRGNCLWQKNSAQPNGRFSSTRKGAPENYLNILEELHIPFILSPWHDKDINRQTGGTSRNRTNTGAFFFDSLKSYSQVSNIISDKLNGPAHVEVVVSPTGLFDYFTMRKIQIRTPYNIEDIEVGCGFNLAKILDGDELLGFYT